MNIVLVSGGWTRVPPERGGGAEAFAFSLARQWSRTGHEVVVLDNKYSSSDPDSEYIDGVRVVRLKARRFTRFSFTVNFVLSQVAFALRVRKYLRTADSSHIIHVYTALLGLVLALTGKSMRRRMVYTSLGLRRDMATPRLLDKMALTVENQLVRRVRKTTIANEIIATKLTREARVKPEDVVVVPIGVDVDDFNPHLDVSDVRQRYGLDGKRNILFVGRICAEKGVEYLVKAASIVVNGPANRSIQFLLVGPTEQFDPNAKNYSPYMARVNKLIADFGLQQDMILTGIVPIDDLRRLYAACDMVVVPSIVDLDPRVQLEAMASGRPVIGTRVGTMPRRIRDGESGFIVDPADEKQLAEKICYLLGDPAEMKRMGAFARKLAEEELASDKMAERMLRVIEDIVSSPR